MYAKYIKVLQQRQNVLGDRLPQRVVLLQGWHNLLQCRRVSAKYITVLQFCRYVHGSRLQQLGVVLQGWYHSLQCRYVSDEHDDVLQRIGTVCCQQLRDRIYVEGRYDRVQRCVMWQQLFYVLHAEPVVYGGELYGWLNSQC